MTVEQLTKELNIIDDPQGHYKSSDIIAEFHRDLVDKYGVVTGSTIITREEAETIREGWSNLPYWAKHQG